MINPALVSLILALAPYGEELLIHIIDSLVFLISGERPVETIVAVSKEIIDGINASNFIRQEDKPRYIADAIAQWHLDNPVTVNKTITS